ncbi:NAD(P)-dependent oxidoreductase [Xanthobacter sp. KR7-65]|uniref:NAD-dependent epimerase/dehydratase family protein n=1 Tax=Xanthobacter sp. KR7-65 TaxID=3156612 RepID=UPI0032B32A56
MNQAISEVGAGLERRIIVFGGAGFIGTHCIRRLKQAGEKVTSVDIRLPRKPVDGVDYQIGDVRALQNFTVPAEISRIYNFAAVHTTPGHADHEYYDTNVGGALEVTRFAEALDVPEIVFTSSISVYGPGEETKNESSKLKPISAYGRSKCLSEQIHVAWQRAGSNRQLVIVRPAVVFGSGEGGNFCRMATLLRKGFFVFPGRRDTIKACIYVEDLLDSIDFARKKRMPLILFNGAYPQRYTIEQIVDAFRRTYFPSAKLIDLPLWLVVGGARLVGALGVLNGGIHPDRVLKLVTSTDVVSDWLTTQDQTFPFALEYALQRWASDTQNRFD